jgi:hypothetical protein
MAIGIECDFLEWAAFAQLNERCAVHATNTSWLNSPHNETVLTTSMFALTSLLAAFVSTAMPPTCPTEADVPVLLGVPAETPCDCLLGRQGRRVVACIDLYKSGPRVKVLVTLPSGASGSEFPLDGPEAGDIAALKVEDWAIKIGEQMLGDRETIRVSASAGAGEDLFIGQEVVTFLALDGTNLARLWTGLGGKLDRRFDSCLLLTDATFKLLPDGRLQRSLTTSRTFKANGISGDLARSLRKECIAARPATKVFQFPMPVDEADAPRGAR